MIRAFCTSQAPIRRRRAKHPTRRNKTTAGALKSSSNKSDRWAWVCMHRRHDLAPNKHVWCSIRQIFANIDDDSSRNAVWSPHFTWDGIWIEVAHFFKSFSVDIKCRWWTYLLSKSQIKFKLSIWMTNERDTTWHGTSLICLFSRHALNLIPLNFHSND